jgi:hypothetical protein
LTNLKETFAMMPLNGRTNRRQKHRKFGQQSNFFANFLDSSPKILCFLARIMGGSNGGFWLEGLKFGGSGDILGAPKW